MNHDDIYDEQLIDLYLMGRMDARRQEELEEHFIGCAQCVEELEMRRAFVQGVRQLSSDEFGQARDFRNWRVLALAASVLLAITGPLSIWSVHELHEARHDYAGLSAANTAFVVMTLVSTRGASDAEAPNVIELNTHPQLFVLELEGDYLPGSEYALSLNSGKSQPVLLNSVVADSRGVLVAGLPSTVLEAGNYTLDVSATAQRDDSRRFELRVVRVTDDAP